MIQFAIQFCVYSQYVWRNFNLQQPLVPLIALAFSVFFIKINLFRRFAIKTYNFCDEYEK